MRAILSQTLRFRPRPPCRHCLHLGLGSRRCRPLASPGLCCERGQPGYLGLALGALRVASLPTLRFQGALVACRLALRAWVLARCRHCGPDPRSQALAILRRVCGTLAFGDGSGRATSRVPSLPSPQWLPSLPSPQPPSLPSPQWLPWPLPCSNPGYLGNMAAMPARCFSFVFCGHRRQI